jgi:hypothetical protein
MGAAPLSDEQRALVQSGIDAHLARLADLKPRYDADLATLYDRMLAVPDPRADIHALMLDELDRWGAVWRTEVTMLVNRCAMLGSDAATPWQDLLAGHDRLATEIGQRGAEFGKQAHKADHDMGMKGLDLQRQTMERLNRLRQRFW